MQSRSLPIAIPQRQRSGSKSEASSSPKLASSSPRSFESPIRFIFEDEAETIRLLEEELNLLRDNAHSIADASKFIDAQRKYQDALSKRLRKGSFPDGYRSVGFEYEFAVHNKYGLGAHKLVGKSEYFSKLFPLEFELETDSGNVLEVGLPPFIIPDKENLFDEVFLDQLETLLSNKLVEVRDNSIEKPVSTMLEKLGAAGFGEGWTPSSDERREMDEMIVEKFTSKNMPSKMTGVKNNIYSQINISLTGAESAEFIDYLATIDQEHKREEEDEKRGRAEKGILGELYYKLKSASVGLGNNALSTHLSKVLANIMAIPDIMNEQNKKHNSDLKSKSESKEEKGTENLGKESLDVKEILYHLAEEYDVSSTVKELHGTWVKAPITDIIESLSLVSAIDDTVIEEMKRIVLAEINTFYEKQIVNEKITIVDTALRTSIAEGLLNNSYPVDKAVEKLKLKGVTAKILIEKVNFYQNEMNKPQEAYDEAQETIESICMKSKQPENKKLDFLKSVVTKMRLELEQTFAQIKLAGGSWVKKDTFDVESFGSGMGVRKDTHVPSLKNERGRITMNVVELRSDYAIQYFINFMKEKRNPTLLTT